MRQLFYLLIFVLLYFIYRYKKRSEYYDSNNNIFKIDKPENWSVLPLYKKISYFNNIITNDYAPYVDKILAKDIVYNICGDQIKIPKIIRILKNPDDIHDSDISDNHLVKASHGSGWLIDLEKNKDITDIKQKLNSWNKIYSSTEKQYTYLTPKFFIEEKIICAYNGLSGSALDIKLYCFYGDPKIILIKFNNKLNFYSIDFEPIRELEFDFEIPVLMDHIINLAKKLSNQFEFVRMDFYIGIDGIYFSEFTFTPKSGHQRFSDETEIEYGKYW
jgi:hypothetical protein